MNRKSIKKIYFNLLPKLFIVIGLSFFALTLGPVVKDELFYTLKTAKSQRFQVVLDEKNTQNDLIEDSIFSRLLSSKPIKLEPVNRDFSIVIEKIGVNAPIVPSVSVTNEKSYNDALKNGIAHALISGFPSKNPGNVYLFAHASMNFWELGKYATTFNLLKKLNPGDKIHVFYDEKIYIYETINKEILPGWNTYPLTRPVIEPILTLQTCDPPGTTLNRFIVTAKLIEVKE